MHRNRSILPLISLVLLAFMSWQEQPAAAQSAPAVPGPGASAPATQDGAEQRVILRVNRNTEVAGYVQLEDDDVIVVRDLKGDVQSFSKPRIRQIVRLVSPEPGQKGVVVLRNGQTRSGIIIEDTFTQVVMEIQNIRARLKRETVDYVQLEPTFREQYEKARAAIQPGMFEAHLQLCQWLAEEKRFDLAKTELDGLLAQKEMPEARQLLNLVQAQIDLAAGTIEPPLDANATQEGASPEVGGGKTTASDDGGDEGTEDDGATTRRSGPVYPADMLPQTLIDRADVNIMRVYEIDFDSPPKVVISADTIRAMLEKYGTNDLIPGSQTERTALFRADPLEVVRLMFGVRARDLYPQIQVLTEPKALNLFRQRVHDTWLINNCATSRCHGGPDGGRLFLYRRNFKDDRVRLTNLLILERLHLVDGWPLINYDDPELSLIIQYGMPRSMARMPHPDVKGWKPVFSQNNERLKGAAIEWIRSMMQPRPDYPIDFEPPMLQGAATQPDADADGQIPR